MVKSYWPTEAGGDLAGDRNSEVKTASAYSPIMPSNSSATSARASDSSSSARLWDNIPKTLIRLGEGVCVGYILVNDT